MEKMQKDGRIVGRKYQDKIRNDNDNEGHPRKSHKEGSV
jgi:hypothetical protein